MSHEVIDRVVPHDPGTCASARLAPTTRRRCESKCNCNSGGARAASRLSVRERGGGRKREGGGGSPHTSVGHGTWDHVSGGLKNKTKKTHKKHKQQKQNAK